MKQLGLAIGLSGIVALALIGATRLWDGSDDSSEGQTQRDVTEAAASLEGGVAGFSRANVGWNGYWYSRYNLGTLAMMSGLGITFAPPEGAVPAMMAMADASPGQGEDVPALKNPALLAAVFASADPRFADANNGDPTDLANGRLDPSTFDTTITPAAQGMLMTKESEWAKFFFTESWAGTREDDFGALDRFKGLALFAGAKMQAKFALENLRDGDGLFVSARPVDGVVEQSGEPQSYDQFVMVMALSAVLSVLEDPEQWQGALRDDATRDELRPALDAFYQTVAERVAPRTVNELSWAARADVWFASVTTDAGLRAVALDNLQAHGDALKDLEPDSVVERAQRIRGLIEAGRVLDSGAYVEVAARDFEAIAEAFDASSGAIEGVPVLRATDAADLIGALNAVGLFAKEFVPSTDVDSVLVPLYEAVMNIGGLQQSAPPPEAEASPFELERFAANPEYFAYPTTPTPAAAGGIAPLTASAVEFRDGKWSVSDERFDSHAAMYVSNEDFWLLGVVSGFRVVEPDAAARTDDGQTALTLLASAR